MALHKIVRSLVILLILPQLTLAEDKAQELDLGQLGFPQQELKSDTDLQKRLEERRFYLRQHQIWGLVATGAMALAVLSGGEGNLPPEHPYLAGLAFTSYSASAYTAWMAPGLPEGQESGGSLWHRRLSWIHVPGMILTPILGYLAAKKQEQNQPLTGIEKHHKDVAGVTAIALALSVLTVSYEF